MDKLAYFLSLLQFQELANRVFESEDKTDPFPSRMTFTFNENKYVLRFPKLENFEDPVVTVVNEQKEQFALQIYFTKKHTKAEFHLKELNVVFCTREQFKYENPMVLLSIM